MNCEQAQEAILMSDEPAAVGGGDTDLGRHVAGCAVCQAFVGRLVRLEERASAMTAPGSDAARRAMMGRMRMNTTVMAPRRRLLLRPAWIGAAAAVLVIGIGLSVWLWPAERSTAVVEQLIDWDLAMADAQGPAERQQIYASLAPSMQSAVQRASLNDEDRRLATSLLENGNWLGKNGDPVERAEKYCDLADLLVVRMSSAAASNDASTVQKLGAHYGKVQKGLGAHLEKLHTVAFVEPEHNKRLEKIAKRSADAQERLQKMAEKSAERATQKALRRAVEQSKRQGIKRAI